jgi:hypothetical protein
MTVQEILVITPHFLKLWVTIHVCIITERQRVGVNEKRTLSSYLVFVPFVSFFKIMWCHLSWLSRFFFELMVATYWLLSFWISHDRGFRGTGRYGRSLREKIVAPDVVFFFLFLTKRVVLRRPDSDMNT